MATMPAGALKLFRSCRMCLVADQCRVEDEIRSTKLLPDAKVPEENPKENVLAVR